VPAMKVMGAGVHLKGEGREGLDGDLGGCALRLAHLLERQERHDGLSAPAVEDDLVGAAKDALHGLQVHALAGYLRRLLVLLIDFEETGTLAGRLGYSLFLVGPS
jgi:hypothetical protein